MNRLSFALAALATLAAGGAHAQPAAPAPAPATGRKPAPAAGSYVLKTAASLAEAEKAFKGPGGQGSTLVPSGPNTALEAVWRHEENKEATGLESHDGRDHVFFITEGHAVFVLGGELEDPREISPGEWRAAKAKGTKEVVVDKGGFLFIPHGLVHGRGKGAKFTMLLLSFWPGGAPPPAPPAAPKTK
jgi:mannose-6-phosphate isomerase-like protein (cupin superfamily)